MVKRQSLAIQLLESLTLVLCTRVLALAVWPPSTAFQEETPVALCGSIIMAFVMGVVLGVWAQRNRDEHK